MLTTMKSFTFGSCSNAFLITGVIIVPPDQSTSKLVMS